MDTPSKGAKILKSDHIKCLREIVQEELLQSFGARAN